MPVNFLATVTLLAVMALVVSTTTGRSDVARKGLAAGSLTLRGHGGPVKSIAVSRDGETVLSASFDNSIIVWQVTGAGARIVHRLVDHDAAVNAVAFLPGEDKAVSASDDGTVGYWDLTAGRLIARFRGHTRKVVRVAVSPDGRYAASAGWDRTARLWDLGAGSAHAVLAGQSGTVDALAFSADGKVVFTAGYDGVIRQWRTSDGALLGQLYRHGWGINDLRRLADGKLLLAAVNGEVAIVDIATGTLVKQLTRRQRPVLATAYAPAHNLIAAAGGDGIIEVWRTGDWRRLYRFEHGFGPIWSLAFSHDGKTMFFGGLDDFIATWQMRPNRPFEVAKPRIPRRFQDTSITDPGALQFARKCSICHTLTPDGGHRAGPTLYGLFGRRVGALPGYRYSPALVSARFEWNAHTIDQLFAQGPEKFLPGTKMPLQKMTDPHQRKVLIEFLRRATAPQPAGAGTSSTRQP